MFNLVIFKQLANNNWWAKYYKIAEIESCEPNDNLHCHHPDIAYRTSVRVMARQKIPYHCHDLTPVIQLAAGHITDTCPGSYTRWMHVWNKPVLNLRWLVPYFLFKSCSGGWMVVIYSSKSSKDNFSWNFEHWDAACSHVLGTKQFAGVCLLHCSEPYSVRFRTVRQTYTSITYAATPQD